MVGDGIAVDSQSASRESVRSRVLSADEWAVQQFGTVDLGDIRLNKRAVQIAAMMAAHPEESLLTQMEGGAALRGAYRLLNHGKVTLTGLVTPHIDQTKASARHAPTVLMVEDTSELDYTSHKKTTGLGPIGDGRGRGLLLHTTLAIIPDTREVLGVAHVEVVLRQPTPNPRPQRADSPEARLWENSAVGVGRPPEGGRWVHVADRGGDVFEFMAECRDRGKDFLVRVQHNRILEWEQGSPEAKDESLRNLINYARRMTPYKGATHTVHVDATKDHPARDAEVVVQWARLKLPPPHHVAKRMRDHSPIRVWVQRVWEENPPEGCDPVEWILLTSVPINTIDDAYRTARWYCCRWICEDYHQCVKTGCKVERSQLDTAADIHRLLGFVIPIAVRLLQLRHSARQSPELPATEVVDPLMVQVLARRRKTMNADTMTIGEFWLAVARLGGHLGRRSDGPPGWRTVWKGFRRLSEMTEGARLFVKHNTS